MRNFFRQTLDSVSASLCRVDNQIFDELLDECEHVLRTNNKIIVSGLGKNVPICEKFVGTMVSLGLNACFMNTNSAMHGDLGLVKKNDLVIVLSKSGSTIESVYLSGFLNKRDIYSWLISFGSQESITIDAKRSLLLYLDNEGDLWDIVPNNSAVIYLIILQTLAMELAQRMEASLCNFKDNHPGGAIGERLRKL